MHGLRHAAATTLETFWCERVRFHTQWRVGAGGAAGAAGDGCLRVHSGRRGSNLDDLDGWE